MTEPIFRNFDLLIEKIGEKYRIRVVDSPAGQANGEFSFPFSDVELEGFIDQVGQANLETIRNFGGKLFNTVFTKDVFTCYMRSLDIAKKLRIRLRLDAPELHNLPWEYLYNPQRDHFLAQSNDTPVVRYFDLSYSTPLPTTPPLKILVMISSPEGYPKLDVEEHWTRLNKALGELIKQGRVILERLESPTLDKLQESLRREDAHIFHYIGHGKYMDRSRDGRLLLEDETGKGIPIGGSRLGTLLQDSDSLRLVVLNACEGARTSAEDPYAGVAQTLVQKGIPSVIAMQFEIFEDAAIRFAQEFYEALVDGSPVDVALSEARKSIFVSGNDREWGTPVLFSRAPDSVMFKAAGEKKSTVSEQVVSPEVPTPQKPDSQTPQTFWDNLRKNPKLFYPGIFFIFAVLVIFGIIFQNNRSLQQSEANTSTAAQADTATAERVQILNVTQEVERSLTATAAAGEVISGPTQTSTATATATMTLPPTLTFTSTPITPPLTDLNRFQPFSSSDDFNVDSELDDAFRALGISTSPTGLSFLRTRITDQGIFGITAPLHKNPKEVIITLEMREISGEGGGEFWIVLFNGNDLEKNSASVRVVPVTNRFGEFNLKLYQSNIEETTFEPGARTYRIRFRIDGNDVTIDINNNSFSLGYPFKVSGGPSSLFIGYEKKRPQGQGTINVDAKIIELDFR